MQAKALVIRGEGLNEKRLRTTGVRNLWRIRSLLLQVDKRLGVNSYSSLEVDASSESIAELIEVVRGDSTGSIEIEVRIKSNLPRTLSEG